MLVVDAANVVGSRPNGWWRDRGQAARNLCAGLSDALDAGRLAPPVVAVLEGAARKGVVEHEAGGLRVVHAAGHGDDAIVDLTAQAVADGHTVEVVTADRELRDRVKRAGAHVTGPSWLLDQVAERA